MNIFEGLKAYAKKKKAEKENSCSDATDEGKNSKGVYVNEYTSRKYNTVCKDAASLHDDAFE